MVVLTYQLLLILYHYYIILLIVVIFAVFLVVRSIQFFSETCYMKKSWASFVFSMSGDPCVSKYAPASYKERSLEDEKEVYYINNQNMTQKQAACKCASYNGRLASKSEIINAMNNGLNNCMYGWAKETNSAFYPVQQCYYNKLQEGPKSLRNSCGVPGLNGGLFTSPNLRFGASCYGIKPKGMVSVPNLPKCEESSFCDLPSNYNVSHKLNADEIAPFSQDQWSQYTK